MSKKYYIRHIAGDDSNSGLSPSTAWRTFLNVNKSDSPLIPGDTVYVGSGAYHGDNVIDTNGQIYPTKIFGGAVHFIADISGDFTGDGGEVSIQQLNYIDYLTFDGFTVQFQSDSTAGGGSGTAIDLKIENCIFISGIRITRPTGIATFRNNIVGLKFAFGSIAAGDSLAVSFLGGNRAIEAEKHYSEDPDAGKFICEFNTIYSPSENTGRAFSCFVQTNNKYINPDGMWFKNNLIINTAPARTAYMMFWEPQRAEDWDWNWHIDNNFYAYGNFNGKFAELLFFFETSPFDFTFAEFDDWQFATISPDSYGFVGTGDSNGSQGDPLFDSDGRHITINSPVINEAYIVGNAKDFEGDSRGNDFQDIGADEFLNEPPGDNYIFTSKIYGHISDNFVPNKAYFKFDFFVYPNDWIRLLASWNGGYRWWEIVNTNTNKFLLEEELTIPGSVRGRNFIFKVEIFQHASNRGIPDFGVEDMSKLRTELVTQEDIQENLKPGMELDFWSIQFPGERAATVIVDKYGNFRTYVWPGSYRVKMVGGGKLAGKEVIVAKGFSDTFARFGQPSCMHPQQYNWSDFEQQFMGIEWAQFGVMELFNNEDGRLNPEPAPLPALVRCGKVVKGQTGSRMVFMACNPTLK